MSEPRFTQEQWDASMGGVLAQVDKEAREIGDDMSEYLMRDLRTLLREAYMRGLVDGFKQATAPPTDRHEVTPTDTERR